MEYNVNEQKESEFKHICGQCNLGFNTEQEYLDHDCNKTGFKPTDQEHLGKAFKAISKAALERGANRNK